MGRGKPSQGAELTVSGRSATASYVAAISADLAAMARRDKLDTLAYLLDMVRLEAEATAQGSERTSAGQTSATNPPP